MPWALLDGLQRILFFADKVVEEIVSEETDLWEKTIPRMFELVLKVAKMLCGYIKHGKWSCSGFSKR